MTKNNAHLMPAFIACMAGLIPTTVFASETGHADMLNLTTHTVGYIASILVHMWINAAHF
ncbi:MAG: hypothetical protein U9P00_03180 [Pseudomonadota bacterium]|nr:hypothetical protein [Pseudomonadota bacterium]